jgi:hypothetical protein
MMSNVWGGCSHCYLVDAGAAVLAVPSAVSALNLELQAVVAAAAGGDAVAGYYQLLGNINTVTLLCKDSS